MTKLTDAELAGLKNRFQKAAIKGHKIAQADDYIKLLAAETGQEVVLGVPKGSAAHLLQLATNALLIRSGKAKKAKAAPAPAPAPKSKPKAAPKPPPQPAPEPEDEVEAGEEPDLSVLPEVETLAELTKDELYEYAQLVDLDGRSALNKDELFRELRKLRRRYDRSLG